MAHPIVKEELELLGRVLESLAQEKPRSSAAEAGLVEELERIRAQLVSGQEQKDRLALLSQWDRASALLHQLRAGRAVPEIDPSAPYFAHLRLEEEGTRDVLLGKATFIRPGVRVVDWRNAPISTLFYRYRQGEDYEEELAGRRRRGRVTARRSVTISAGSLRRVDAPEGSFTRDAADPSQWILEAPGVVELAGGEGSALRAAVSPSTSPTGLGAPAPGPSGRVDRRLPEIAALLDADQFDLISRPGPGILALRGSAGSGKTTVALHRIAFLAYANPEIDSPRTLFMTLSPALRDYVSHVLPSLGVRQVRVTTFGEWAAAARRRLFPELPEAGRTDTPDAVRRLKLHPALEDAFAQQLQEHPGPPTPRQAADDWASVLSRPELLRRTVGRGPLALSEGDLARAVEWARQRNRELDDQRGADALDPEDDALLLRAYQLRAGPLLSPRRRPLRYLHLAIDEVQDYSPLELRVALECAAEPASVTLAGDLQQRTGTVGFHSWRELTDWLGLDEVEVSTLRVSYRSARPIMRFARAVLGSERDAESSAESVREGPPVQAFRFGDAGACVAFLADALHRLAESEPLAAVAVLAPDAASAELYYRGLDASDVPRLEWVRDYRFSFTPGVAVAEIEQAKGLEFDYVILVDVGAQVFGDTPAARRLLHVGATRAIHQLWVTSVEPASPLLGVLAPPAA